jgi:NAD(P)-dependent dehydrogenase (short-subunit alcohol dehydrogenase family)
MKLGSSSEINRTVAVALTVRWVSLGPMALKRALPHSREERKSMEPFAKDRVALITGGARGIGYACARNLSREGVKVAIVDISGDRIKESARKLTEETGTPAIGIQADISVESDVARMVAEANATFGKVDIFLNSAAILADNLFLDSTPADWDRMFKVCLTGPMLCLRALLPGMVERKYGRVVCMASDSARIGQARLSYYAAAKGGVIALVKSVAQEVGRSGITMNVVSPGATSTELRQEREEAMLKQMGQEKYDRRVKTVLKMYPTGRIGEPADAAAMITFLLSDQAAWVTGQVISVNGGFVML